MPDRNPLIRVTAMPTDMNPYGGVFGGWLMSQMALGAGSLASRIGEGRANVVAATDFGFPAAMMQGDELSIYCEVEREGNTSITIAAEGIARERHGEATKLVCKGTFVFVLTHDDGTPRPVRAAGAAALDGAND
ncbi:acyl-CoA thioesterase [Erythrobacter sp. LQ02-29]|uniref:acyl-CoA thioesterase n=1 Tax=Erythrobacter sp. LQ02-29 TaxID=2920384 RepID=UPI001F4DFA79|nr:hotdog domain-containing protein [Erythrobacter sp. LQ02-29]MCP9223243.1 acyl-CoA thioesterase [Erythrobacter sp. LQ02-29]